MKLTVKYHSFFTKINICLYDKFNQFILKTILLLIIIVLPLICFAQKEKKVKKQTTFTEFGTCYDSRETTGTIESSTGKIIKVNDQIWAVQPDNSNTRYGLCEIPDKLKVENLKIKFSGEIKKIAPNERMAASPFKMKTITILK